MVSKSFPKADKTTGKDTSQRRIAALAKIEDREQKNIKALVKLHRGKRLGG